MTEFRVLSGKPISLKVANLVSTLALSPISAPKTLDFLDDSEGKFSRKALSVVGSTVIFFFSCFDIGYMEEVERNPKLNSLPFFGGSGGGGDASGDLI